MHEFEFENKKVNTEKLLSFGFSRMKDCYAYSAELPESRMRLDVVVTKDGRLKTRVLDSSGEEYILHLVATAAGSFVGQVRTEYEEQLAAISSECFEADVFKSRQAKEVISYMKDKFGDEPEYLWKKFSGNAVVRRKDNEKWYAALLTVSRRRLGLDSDEKTEILDLRMKPEDVVLYVDGKKYFPGYHMNKKHWVTVCLDDTVSIEEIFGRIDESYVIAGNK